MFAVGTTKLPVDWKLQIVNNGEATELIQRANDTGNVYQTLGFAALTVGSVDLQMIPKVLSSYSPGSD